MIDIALKILFQCAKIIKEAMEEKYGGMGFWQVRLNLLKMMKVAVTQVVIGESFGIDMTYDLESLFYMYFVGTVACFVWKCSRSQSFFLMFVLLPSSDPAITHHKLFSTRYLQFASCYLLIIAYCSLLILTTCCLLHATSYLLLAALWFSTCQLLLSTCSLLLATCAYL